MLDQYRVKRALMAAAGGGGGGGGGSEFSLKTADFKIC